MPWVNSPANGSSMPTWPVAFLARVKKREYKRCRIACSTPPIYWSTGMKRSATARVVGAVSFHGSVKRAKYHDESTKVSIVSVSRVALGASSDQNHRPTAQRGHGTCFQV